LYRSTQVRAVLAEHGVRLKQSLGQNFLFERNAVAKFVRAAELVPDDVVLEIGPGIGHLTYQLLQHARHVIAVELDQRLLPILRDVLGGSPHFTLIHGDILRVPLQEHCQAIGLWPTIVVANVPYYITTPILTRLIAQHMPLRRVVLTMQKEVAERCIAAPGSKEYGSLSVVMRYWGAAAIVAHLTPACFIPPPKVASAVLRVDLHQTPPVALRDEALFYKIVRGAFMQRRKMLRNALLPHCATADLDVALAEAGIDGTRRPETLALEEFARLANALAAR
jgi:16S rRNA (adenine1518-N6/adenine1519-N6)-dimethyltransferase